MEKILNDREKIRKAEEIYFRRNNSNFNLNSKEKVSKEKNNIWLNLLLMFNLAIIVFCVQNKDFIFTKEFLNKIDGYNIEVGNMVKNFLKENFLESDIEKINAVDTIESNLQEKGEVRVNGTYNEILEENTIIESQKNITNSIQENLVSTLDEMEEDIKNLKIAYSFSNPLQGIVSSTFGARESKYQNVSGYHTGIDIAANTGTLIKASMEGIVEEVSSKGDYGNHVKIRCNNVMTLYAHCSKIYVKEGQIVAQGEKIAEVGNTGNSTGPHLHFEIRVDDRFVDPGKIIDFN